MRLVVARSSSIAALLCGLTLGCAVQYPVVWIEATQDMTLPASDLEGLRVETHNGRIALEGREETDQIQVTVTKRAGGLTLPDAEECMDAVEVFARREGPTQRLGWRWNIIRRHTWGADVSFAVVLPGEFDCRASTHNGAIVSEQVRGNCHFVTHNGRIEAEGVQGDVHVRTHNGSIVANGSAKDVTAISHNGRIQVRGFDGDAHLETHNGAVVAQGRARQIRVISHSGPVEADLRGSVSLGGAITTHNGAVKVLLNDSTNATIRVGTYNGSVTTDIPLQDAVVKRSVVTGHIGEGGDLLEIATHNGAITLTH
ncbi:MAG: DUF4097 family beta strand repeat protein [Phycisphaerales bacterium]|nr:MAG: DUF4097 family beta strand repeat protein [Phycisphaerales bacterium]